MEGPKSIPYGFTGGFFIYTVDPYLIFLFTKELNFTIMLSAKSSTLNGTPGNLVYT